MDGVNLDEINTSVGLMSRQAGGSGFCARCLARFRRHLLEMPEKDPSLSALSDRSLRERLRVDDLLYEQYRQFHVLEAYHTVADQVRKVRALAQEWNPDFAITANVAYLGNLVAERGDLWGPMWAQLLDFVMMENIYQPDRSQGHQLLPRGKFTAWYRLGSALTCGAPTWICPSIMVPRQLAGQTRTEYYTLMFVEAYANNGRWGFNWWPGADPRARVEATVPAHLQEYIHLFKRYRHYLEPMCTRNTLAILYLNSSIRVRPQAHFKYLALAQALYEAGYQYDVLYGGDGIYGTDALDVARLSRYKVILLPEAGSATGAQTQALAEYVHACGAQLIQFVPDPAEPDARGFWPACARRWTRATLPFAPQIPWAQWFATSGAIRQPCT